MIEAIRVTTTESHTAGTWHIIRRDEEDEPTSICGIVKEGEITTRGPHGELGETGRVEAKTLSELKDEIELKFGKVCKKCSERDLGMNFKVQLFEKQLKSEIQQLALEEGVTGRRATEYLVNKGLEAHKSERHTPTPEEVESSE